MSKPVRGPRGVAIPFGDEHKWIYTDPVFLIGNGASRKDFDLERLREKGTIIGCNALYRDFTPDLLTIIDAKMIKEVRESGYMEQENALVMVPLNRQAGMEKSLKWRTDQFNTSGCFSMKLISEILKPETCYMLGMDGFQGNVYDGTVNYAQNSLKNFTGVLSYYLRVLKHSKWTTFVNVNTQDVWPEDCHTTGRYKHITYDQFEAEVFG